MRATTASMSPSPCADGSADGTTVSTTNPWRRATARAAPLPPAPPSLNRRQVAAAVMTSALRSAGLDWTMNAPAAWPVSALAKSLRTSAPTSVIAAPNARTNAAALAPSGAPRSTQLRNPAPARPLNPTAPPLKMPPSVQSDPRGAGRRQVDQPQEVPATAALHRVPGTTAPASTTEAGPIAAAAAPAGRQPAGMQCPG